MCVFVCKCEPKRKEDKIRKRQRQVTFAIAYREGPIGKQVWSLLHCCCQHQPQASALPPQGWWRGGLCLCACVCACVCVRARVWERDPCRVCMYREIKRVFVLRRSVTCCARIDAIFGLIEEDIADQQCQRRQHPVVSVCVLSLWVHVHIYMSAFIIAQTYIHVHTHTTAHKFKATCIRTAYVSVCVCVHVHVYTHARTHAYRHRHRHKNRHRHRHRRWRRHTHSHTRQVHDSYNTAHVIHVFYTATCYCNTSLFMPLHVCGNWHTTRYGYGPTGISSSSIRTRGLKDAHPHMRTCTRTKAHA